ncbi:MAG: hypothetical protein KA015_03325 [Spirochaetes bacterium]|nr:hypothetical protein [Spirochaetota bacterium]
MKKVFLLILLFADIRAGEDVFKSVETIGFQNFPPAVIFNDSGLRKKGDSYTGDIRNIRKAMKSYSYFREYEVKEKDGRLSIAVTERIPAYRILACSDFNFIFEIDSDYRIISSGRAFSKAPLLVINTVELKNGKLSDRICVFLEMIEIMKTSFTVASEIEEIDLTDGRKAVLKLRNRRTKFCFFAEKVSFAKIDALTGYFDRYSVYPECVELYGENAVLY